MLDGAVFAKLQVPPIVVALHAKLLDARFKYIESLFSLAAAAQFSDAGNEQIGCGDGLSVVVHAHVEGLDLFGIIGYEYRAAEVLLGKISFVLGLKVAAPIRLVLECCAAFFENLDSVCVAYAGEFSVSYAFEALDEALVHEAV